MLKFETIETERLILRKFTPEIFGYIFENFEKTEIKVLLGFQSDDEFQKEKNKYDQGYSTYNRSLLFFQIVDKQTMKIIGGCGFHNWYFDHRRAELGYSITNEDYKNLGVMSEALKAIIDYGFKTMNLHRIEALVGSQNTPSLRLMEKFGFTEEGLLKEHYFINGKFEDSKVFGKLNKD